MDRKPRMSDKDWPQNLWEEMNHRLPRWAKKEDELEKPSIIFTPNLDSVLEEALDDRQQKIIRMVFEQGVTYRKIGETFGVSVERARQIKGEAIRKLREPKYYLRLCAVPKMETMRLRFEVGELTRQKKELEEQIAHLNGLIRENQRVSAAQLSTPLDTPIAELDLSVRCLTCLTKHGVKTIGELLNYSISDLQGIRNLGRKSARDIERALNARGYELKQEG